MLTSRINRTLLHAKRYQEILRVLLRYGFQDVVVETGLEQLIGKGRGLLGKPVADEHTRGLPRSVRVRKAMEALGPTYVKMGQILSTRPDLIPSDWALELGQLQDDCARLPYEEIHQRLKEEFGSQLEELFEEISPEAFAAGSLAQVHQAVLRGGEQVVIKVLRPDARLTVEADMEVLAGIAQFVERHFSEQGYSPTEVVEEFSRRLRREVNLINEARMTERFREQFRDDPQVCFPKVYWEATTANVITLERISGVFLSRLKGSEFTPEQRRKITANGADAVFRQCFDFGFFHADPHPGNLIALTDCRICFIDCGMTGHLDHHTAEQLADVVAGVVAGDLDQVVGVLVLLSNADPALAANRAFRSDAWELLSRFQNSTLSSLKAGVLLDQFFYLLRRHRIRLPGDLVLLLKAIMTIESVGRSLDPDFDIVGHLRPHIEELLKRRYGMRALKDRMEKTVLRYAKLAEVIPEGLESLIAQIRGNRFSVKLEHRGLDRLTDTVEHASRNISYSLIIAALLVGSSILLLAASMSERAGLLEIGALGALAAAVVVTIGMLASNRYR